MKKIVNISLWVLLFAGVSLLLGFSLAERKDARCWKIEVEVEQLSGLYFIDADAVKAQLLSLGDPILGTLLDSLDISRMHEALMLMPSVKNAEVFTSNDWRLNVEVSQRTPLFRILNNDGSSFYVDVDGRRMPLSSEYTARVPILTGAVNIPFSVLESNAAREALLEDAIELFRFIEADPLWSAQTEHIVVTNHNEFEIVPRVGAHRILLGNTDHLYDKFARLRSFYDAMVLENNFNKYKRINLKFRNQVVCERYF